MAAASDLEKAVFGVTPWEEASDILEQQEQDASQPTKRKREPAWVDEDDDHLQVPIASGHTRLRKLRKEEGEDKISGTEYEGRLREKFNQLAPELAWASLDREKDSAAQVDVLQSSSAVIRTDSATLPSKVLKVRRLRDANSSEPCEAAVQSCRWHPNGEVLLTASLDKKMRLFHIDSQTGGDGRNASKKLYSAFFQDLPIRCARLTVDGSEAILSGRRKYFYAFDLGSAKARKIPRIPGRAEKSLETFVLSPDGKFITFLGNDGNMILLNAKTKRWVTNLRMNGSVRAAAFTPDGRELLSIGGSGEVYRWDLRKFRCVQRFRDEGNLGGTALAVSPDGNYFATGAETGVVNLYSKSSLQAGSTNAKPLKAIMNLTTPIDCLSFNHDSQVLAMSSRRKREQLKLFHIPSRSVFSNWPTAATPLRWVSDLDFSPGSESLVIGTDRGNVLQYSLRHYAPMG